MQKITTFGIGQGSNMVLPSDIQNEELDNEIQPRRNSKKYLSDDDLHDEKASELDHYRYNVFLSGDEDVGDNEIRILNRIVRITDRGLEYEADPRHVELIVESLQLQDSKPVTSPGVKNPDSSTEAATKDDDPSSTSATVQAGLEPGETSEETLEPENLLE